MSTALPSAAIVCVVCGTTRDAPIAKSGTPRTPKGWKILQGKTYCPTCKLQRYVLRAVTIPVSGPVDATWEELRVALRQAWGDATACANWMMRQHALHDGARQPGEAKLAKMPRIYVYPEARALWPALDSGCVSALHQRVQAAYRAARYDLVWRASRSLPTYRYPLPLPIRRQEWTVTYEEQRWHLAMRLLSGGRWFTLRLRQGLEMRRQMRVLAQIASGEAEAGEAALYEVTAHDADHRTGQQPGRTRLMAKIAVWVPRAPAADRSSVLYVRTSTDAFLTASDTVDAASPEWTLHGDHIRRALAGEARQRRALSDDLKAERRRPRRQRRPLVDRLGQISERSRHRLTTWCQQAACQVVGVAQRRHVGLIVLDDQQRSFVRSFPWDRLRQEIAQRCEVAGIAYQFASGTAAQAPSEALATDENADV